MNPKSLIKLGNIISISSVILIPLSWVIASQLDILLLNIAGFTLYTWFYLISWYAVVFVMIIRPLADIFPKQKYLRQLCLLRRTFGILSATIIVTLLLDKWITNPTSFIVFFSPSEWSLWYPLVARLSELTALILLFTSNNFSQKYLKKNWKRLQRTSYVYFITWGILAMRYGDDYFVAASMTLVIAIFLFAFGLKIYRKRTIKIS